MPDLSGNLLLDDLPISVRRSCLQSGEHVSVVVGEEVVAQGDRATHAFFPSSAVCSLTMGLKSGDKAEAATVGREGFIGLSLVNAPARSPFAGIVHVAGDGYKLGLPKLASLLDQHRELREAVLVYAGYALNLVGRSVACNAYHSIVERLARWLLIIQDRVKRDEFSLTHDILSQMLAATRPRVSLAAAKLRASQIIDYRRGFVRILDRKKLEQVACECYEAAKRYQLALPWVRS
jgi:CRP-like cAMP-binding protein